MKIERQVPLPNRSSFEKMFLWVREHPTTMKVMQIAGLIIGIGMIVGTACTASLLGIGVIGMALPGALLTVVFTISLLTLDIFVPPHHDMKDHAFKPGKCEGGRLYYEGDVPILTLDTDDPFKAGKAHGYLCGDAIGRIIKRFLFMLRLFERQPRASELTTTLEALRKIVPEAYLKEIDGLAAGYKKWASEHPRQLPKKITADDILLFHLMPDIVHFKTRFFKGKKEPFACTAIVDKDPQGGFVFGRNLDWPSLKLGGKYSLLIHRKNSSGVSIVGFGAPSLVGIVTGMNKRLACAMNVCTGKTDHVRGIPASFYNRLCLEQCQTVGEVEAFVKQQSPLGPYHLTVADEREAKAFHFYQGESDTHLIREWKEGSPLTTLNCRYHPTLPPYSHKHYSKERQLHIDHFLKHRNNRPLEEALALPFVNNYITTHRVLMGPQSLKVAFNNAYAGDVSLQEVPIKRFFDS